MIKVSNHLRKDWILRVCSNQQPTIDSRGEFLFAAQQVKMVKKPSVGNSIGKLQPLEEKLNFQDILVLKDIFRSHIKKGYTFTWPSFLKPKVENTFSEPLNCVFFHPPPFRRAISMDSDPLPDTKKMLQAFLFKERSPEISGFGKKNKRGRSLFLNFGIIKNYQVFFKRDIKLDCRFVW